MDHRLGKIANNTTHELICSFSVILHLVNRVSAPMLDQRAIRTQLTHRLSTQHSKGPLMAVDFSGYHGAPDTTQGYNNTITTEVY